MTAADRSWEEPYEWLRQDETAMREVLEHEAGHARARTAHLHPQVEARLGAVLGDVLRAEMPPAQAQGAYWYLPLFSPGRRHPSVVRVPRGAVDEAPPEAEDVQAGSVPHEEVLDLDRMLEGTSSAVGAVVVCRTGVHVVWTEDPTGAERFRVHVQEPGSHRVLHTIEEAGPGVVLTQDGQHLLWTELDRANRPFRVWSAPLHALDRPSLLLEEDDPGQRLRLHACVSGRFVLVERRSRLGNSHALVDASRPTAPVPVPPPPGATQHSLEHAVVAGQDVLVATATSADRPHGWCASLALGPGGTVPADGWTTRVPYHDVRHLGAPLLTRGLILCPARTGASEQILRARTDDPALVFEEIGVSDEVRLALAGTPEWETDVVRVATTSWTRPRAVRAVDLGGDLEEVTTALRSDGTDTPYREQTLLATAADGEQIPVTVVRRADLDGPGPCLVTGYGAYGTSPRPHVAPLLHVLLDAGVTWAFAHVRGSDAKGPGWHRQATGLGKPTSFTDFLACVDHLVATGLADPAAVVAQGGSAGGLLVGRALTMAPERFAAVVLDAPFVDPLVTMLHPELPLTINDRGEWGDPIVDPQIAACMRSYSPCHTVSPDTSYPPVLLTTSPHDSRVSPVEPLKFAQRLRAAGTDVVVLPTAGGHSGGASAQETLATLLLEYLWIAEQLGLELEPA